MLGPILLIVLGLLFLLNNLYPEVYRFSRMWPVILIVIGLVKVAEYFRISGAVPRKKAPDNVMNAEVVETPGNRDDHKDIRA